MKSYHTDTSMQAEVFTFYNLLMNDLPLNPVAAVTHPDPYPYYAELVTHKPIYYDAALGLWIATSAEAIEAVLTSELCRVRPASEPIPKALLGSRAADIFGALVRMTDGPSHGPRKQAVSTSLGSLVPEQVSEQSQHWAKFLIDEIKPQADPTRFMDFAFRMPVYVVADLLGVLAEQLAEVAVFVKSFVACFSPLSDHVQLEAGKVAAAQLFDLMRAQLATQPAGGLLTHLALGFKPEEAEIATANAIGFLFQSYEATAGLIGNSLMMLATQREVYQQIKADPSHLRLAIHEVSRYDPSIQNTRRFLAQSGVVAGQAMKEGEAVLVVLAAANRDPAANSEPALFKLDRPVRKSFTFGLGRHACPGETLAVTIAEAAVGQLLATGFDPEVLADGVTYRSSVNARVPLWTTA
jgi:cytochrome P450